MQTTRAWPPPCGFGGGIAKQPCVRLGFNKNSTLNTAPPPQSVVTVGSDLSLGGSVSSSTKERRHTSLRGLQVRLPEITGHTPGPGGPISDWHPCAPGRCVGRSRPRPGARQPWAPEVLATTSGHWLEEQLSVIHYWPPTPSASAWGGGQHGRGLAAPPGSRASVRTDRSPAPLNIFQGTKLLLRALHPDHQEGQLYFPKQTFCRDVSTRAIFWVEMAHV